MKKYIIILASVLIVSLFIVQKCTIEKLKDSIQIKNVELSVLNDSVNIYKSKNGDLTFKIKSVEVDSDNLKKAIETSNISVKELRARDIKWRNIVSTMQTQIEANGSGSTTITDTIMVTKSDTIKSGKFKYHGEYLNLSGSIQNNKLDFNYSYQTKINVITERKGKNIIVSSYLSDPNASITNANSITIINKKRWYEKPLVWGVAGILSGYAIFH